MQGGAFSESSLEAHQAMMEEVGALLEEHREHLDALKDIVSRYAGFDAARHDDLCLLRYILTHKEVKASADAFRSSLSWRAEHKMDEFAERIRREDLDQSRVDGYDVISRYLPFHLIVAKGQDGGARLPIVFISAKEADPAGLMTHVSPDAYSAYIHRFTELVAIFCDLETRRTGRLVRQLRLVDCTGLGVHHINVPYLRMVASALKGAETSYPQLLGSMIICNGSMSFSVLWSSTLRHLLPKRMVEKAAILRPSSNARDCERLFELLPRSCVPLQLGGDLRLGSPRQSTAPASAEAVLPAPRAPPASRPPVASEGSPAPAAAAPASLAPQDQGTLHGPTVPDGARAREARPSHKPTKPKPKPKPKPPADKPKPQPLTSSTTDGQANRRANGVAAAPVKPTGAVVKAACGDSVPTSARAEAGESARKGSARKGSATSAEAPGKGTTTAAAQRLSTSSAAGRRHSADREKPAPANAGPPSQRRAKGTAAKKAPPASRGGTDRK